MTKLQFNSFWLFGLDRRRWGKRGLKTKKENKQIYSNATVEKIQHHSGEKFNAFIFFSFLGWPRFKVYRKRCVFKFLSSQNLGNFSFKESSKLKREITPKNLDEKFRRSWLIKILNFNTLKPNVRSMNSKLQFHNYIQVIPQLSHFITRGSTHRKDFTLQIKDLSLNC